MGITTVIGFFIAFDRPEAVGTYLPASGADGPLDSNLLDPTSTSSGDFGGQVLALQLNVEFANAGTLKGNAHIRFGDLTLCKGD